MSDSLRVTTDSRGVATVTMSRPEVHNAFDDGLIRELEQAFRALSADEAVRVVVLAGEGKSFSAGADLNWMKRMAGYSDEENYADAMGLARMLDAIDRCPKPVLARVQGAALGGGVGLVAACDMAVAAEEAKFGLTEVRLGLIPAVIAPYVIGAIGGRASRRYMLTAERFGAAEAHRLGLVHEVVPAAELNATCDRLAGDLLKGGPQALAACKDLIRTVRDIPLGDEDGRNTAHRHTARQIADRRASDEGREGITAFLEKRKPGWVAE